MLKGNRPKGELDGDTGLVRGERSAGLLAGQAGAGATVPSVRQPAKPGQSWRHPAKCPSGQAMTSLSFLVLRWSQIRAFGACHVTRGERRVRPCYASTPALTWKYGQPGAGSREDNRPERAQSKANRDGVTSASRAASSSVVTSVAASFTTAA